MSVLKNDMKRICLFGSSFNPPTKAHVEILKYFLRSGKFDEVWLVPVYKHIYASKSNLELFEDRYNMCSLAIDGIDGLKLVDVEKTVYNSINGPIKDQSKLKKVGTIDLLSFLKKTYSENNFHFIMGADAYVDLCQGKWKNGDQIPKMAHLEVVQRDKVPTQEELRNMKFGESSSFHRVETISEKVSSTRARQLRSLNELKEIIPEKVAEYVQEHELYAFKSKL